MTDLASGQSQRIEFPEPAYSSYPWVNKEFDTTKFRYGYQSFITPRSVFEYDIATGKSTLLKQKEVPGGYDRTKYQVEQIYAPAADGVKVPVSVVHLKDAKKDGKGPMYLTAYGSYGASYDIRFDSDVFSLVDRGVSRRHRAHPRRRRDGQGLARRRPHDAQEKHLHRLHRRRRVPGRRRDTARRTAW